MFTVNYQIKYRHQSQGIKHEIHIKMDKLFDFHHIKI